MRECKINIMRYIDTYLLAVRGFLSPLADEGELSAFGEDGEDGEVGEVGEVGEAGDLLAFNLFTYNSN